MTGSTLRWGRRGPAHRRAQGVPSEHEAEEGGRGGVEGPAARVQRVPKLQCALSRWFRSTSLHEGRASTRDEHFRDKSRPQRSRTHLAMRSQSTRKRPAIEPLWAQARRRSCPGVGPGVRRAAQGAGGVGAAAQGADGDGRPGGRYRIGGAAQGVRTGSAGVGRGSAAWAEASIGGRRSRPGGSAELATQAVGRPPRMVGAASADGAAQKVSGAAQRVGGVGGAAQRVDEVGPVGGTAQEAGESSDSLEPSSRRARTRPRAAARAGRAPAKPLGRCAHARPLRAR